MSSATPPPATQSLRTSGTLSTDFAKVLEAFQDRAVTLGEIVTLMQERAYSFLLVLIAIPFCTPIQIPGFSTPFGLIIAYLGTRIALGLPPSLPKRALDYKLPGRLLPRILRAAEKPVRWLEKMLHPHLSVLVSERLGRRAHGALLVVNGSLLALPLPFPLTNFFPALSTLFLSCALLEKDGRFSIAGTFLFVISCSYFALLGIGGMALVDEVWDWVRERV